MVDADAWMQSASAAGMRNLTTYLLERNFHVVYHTNGSNRSWDRHIGARGAPDLKPGRYHIPMPIVNRSFPPGSVVPVLAYHDVPKAIEWLCDAFGFAERLRTPPEPDGAIHHAQLLAGKGAVMLTCRRGGPGASDWRRHETPISILVHVEDVDAHFEHAKQFGARILNPPHTAEFGERQYSAEDLAGYHWAFSQSMTDVAPEQWGAQVSRLE